MVVHALGGLVYMKDAAKDIANTASAEGTDHIQITTKRNGVTVSEVNLCDKTKSKYGDGYDNMADS